MTTNRIVNLDNMSEEQLAELKEEIDRRLHSEQPIDANSSDIMTLFAHRFITEQRTIPVSEWVSYRYGSVVDFRAITHRKNTNSYIPGFFRCDSSVAPIDSYEKFKKMVTVVTFDEMDDQEELKPYSIYKCDRDNLSDNELIFGAGCSNRMLYDTVDTATRKPKRMLKSFDNDNEFLDIFVTDRADYFSGENPLCMFIFTAGEYEFYIIDESESAMYLIVKENQIVSYVDNVTGNNAVFHLYDDGKILAIGEDSCTVLIPTIEQRAVMTLR